MAELKAKRIIKEKKEQLRQENKASRTIKEKEKQLRSEKWRAAHPGWKRSLKAKKGDQPGEGFPAWVEDWLKQQVRNFLHSHPERTEEQIIELCRLIYLAKRHHNDKRGRQSRDNYARREKLREESDGHYLDRHVMPEIKSWTKG